MRDLQAQLSARNKELKDLKDSILAVEAQAVEKLCTREGPLINISDSYVSGLYK